MAGKHPLQRERAGQAGKASRHAASGGAEKPCDAMRVQSFDGTAGSPAAERLLCTPQAKQPQGDRRGG